MILDDLDSFKGTTNTSCHPNYGAIWPLPPKQEMLTHKEYSFEFSMQ